MTDVATVTIKAETRPLVVTRKRIDPDSVIDGEVTYIVEERRAIAHMTKTSMHGGFVVEYEDGTVGEVVQGVDKIRFLDSDGRFSEICWEVRDD